MAGGPSSARWSSPFYSTTLAADQVWGETAKGVDLGAYRWQNRLLLVFAPSAELPAYQQCAPELERQRRGIVERDLIVFRIFDQGQSFKGDAPLGPEAAISFRQRFGVSGASPRVVLIGKDGGVKLDQAALVPLADIFGFIDSMPMRRQEMKERP
jgi:hypothetical protein